MLAKSLLLLSVTSVCHSRKLDTRTELQPLGETTRQLWDLPEVEEQDEPIKEIPQPVGKEVADEIPDDDVEEEVEAVAESPNGQWDDLIMFLYVIGAQLLVLIIVCICCACYNEKQKQYEE